MSVLVAPLGIPLVTALLAAAAPRRAGVQHAIGVTGAALLFVAAVRLLLHVHGEGVVAVQMGDWPAPFGITLVADLLSAAMVAVSAAVGLAVAIYACAEPRETIERGSFVCFSHILMLGVCGAFLTGDLFNLYVWFEVMLLASFVLLVASGERSAVTSGVAYVALNLLASAFFLVAVGLLYSQLGSLNLADLRLRLDLPGAREAAGPAAAFLLVAFGIKAGLFPVFFWLPASYPTPAFAVSALFAGLLTKVGVYALLRMFTLLFPDPIGGPLVAVAVATMATGVLAAASQSHVRRILSFHIVSQIGYIVLGLALATSLGVASAIFYTLHHIVTKTNLFLVGGLIARAGGGESLARLGGISARGVGLSLLFAIPALSLAGIPPLSGFFAKLFLIRASLQAEAFVAAGAAVGVGLLTIFSMAKIWNEAFWKAAPEEAPDLRLGRAAVIACAGLCVLTVGIGIGAEVVWELANDAARQLDDPQEYLRAVLGDGS
ncbi:MAG: proton-conducting transporter membrane subunit [Myxococcota bacterium]|nr:proton-conducting transporter membrane subunit [Myxococcota bacterium]